MDEVDRVRSVGRIHEVGAVREVDVVHSVRYVQLVRAEVEQVAVGEGRRSRFLLDDLSCD